MTISTTESRVSYTGNGSTTSFAVPFDFDADADLKVELITTSTNDVELQTIVTDYTISGSNVVFGTAPPSTKKVLITFGLDFGQTTDYTTNDPFPAETHENALDELAKQIKELKHNYDYNIPKLPSNLLTDTTVTDTDIGANKVFHINSTGDGVGLSTPASILDINALTDTPIAASDEIVFSDASDSNNIKKDTVQGIIDLINASEVNDLTSSVTWANVPDANITESSVTQHQAALTITESQISDLTHTTARTDEEIQDVAGAMFTGNTETGVTVTYQDSDGTIDVVVSDTTVAGDSGSTGITPGDTLTIAGGTNATTSMSGDTLTINVDDAFLSNSGDAGTGTYTITGDLSVDNLTFNGNVIGSSSGDITLTPNGTSNVTIGSYTFDADQTVGAGQDNYVLTYDNASGLISLEASAGGGSGDAWSDAVDADIIPDADGTRDLGATATRFAETYTDALDVTNNIVVGGTVDGRDVAADGTKLDGIESGADVTDATNVDAAGAVMNSDTSTAAMSFVIDEDNMASDSATKVPTQQSVKAYVDSQASGIANVVDDTTPQLGGQLDVNGQAIGDGTRELITFTEDASAVNHINIENEATGNGPIIRAAGDDTNIELNLKAKGSGKVTIEDSITIDTQTIACLSGALILSTSSADTLFSGGNAGFLSSGMFYSDGIYQIGDSTNSIEFTSDTQTFDTGGSSRMDITNSGVRLGGANARVTTILDQDTMSSDSATALATQQSIKAYIDSKVRTNQSNVACNSNTTFTQDIDTAHYFKLTFTSNCTLAFTFNTGEVAAMTVELINAGAYTVTLPAGLQWAGGSAPTFTSSGTDVIVVWNNGDDVIRAATVGQDFS